MTRQQVYKEIKDMLGVVPTMMKQVPDSTLGLERELFKRVQFEEGAVPNKYRELIGLAISAVTKCKYCTYFHSQVAKVAGATDAEIEDALHFAKSVVGWSAYVNGLQLDYETFKKEVRTACAHVRAMQSGGKSGRKRRGR